MSQDALKSHLSYFYVQPSSKRHALCKNIETTYLYNWIRLDHWRNLVDDRSAAEKKYIGHLHKNTDRICTETLQQTIKIYRFAQNKNVSDISKTGTL